MSELKLGKKMQEFEVELKKRLSGAKDEDKMDDQLLKEACNLQKSEYEGKG